MLYPPFDSSRFAGSVDAHSGAPSALVVSRLLPYKRVDIAIRACALAGIPLTIIGRGPDEERLRSIAPELVTFAGSVTDDELIDAYDKHSMVLVPGIEDFGYIPLEAASRGRPVVAAREGGPAETVVDGTTGILVAGADPKTWADAHPPGERGGVERQCHAAIRRALRGPPLRRRSCSAVLRVGAAEQHAVPATSAWLQAS